MDTVLDSTVLEALKGKERGSRRRRMQSSAPIMTEHPSTLGPLHPPSWDSESMRLAVKTQDSGASLRPALPALPPSGLLLVCKSFYSKIFHWFKE